INSLSRIPVLYSSSKMIRAFRPFQSSEALFNARMRSLVSVSLTNTGNRLLVLGDTRLVVGILLTTPCFSKYLKNDFREEILRLTERELSPCSLSEASQLRRWICAIEVTGVFPKPASRYSKKSRRSVWYET